MCDTIKTIIFVPRESDIKTYRLTDNELHTLLDSLEDECIEIEPDIGIYTVHSIEKVAEIYSTLFTQTNFPTT